MATPAQITANIANAQHSTGPRTEEGKQRAAANSTSHGLAGTFAVLSHENQSEFDLVRERLIEEFQAETEHERFLVDQMAQARWRISRVDRIENCALDQMTKDGDPKLDPDSRIAAHMLANGAAILSALQRYRTAAQNAYLKCQKQLTASQADRVADRAVARLDHSIARMINAPMPAAQSSYTGPGMPVNRNASLRL